MIDLKIKKLKKIAKQIIDKESEMQKLDDNQLRLKTFEFKSRLERGESLGDLLVPAFAVCREATSRVLGMKHYEVQIMGGIVLHQGRAIQMKTGEGKTITALLPAYLNALEGEGVHIATANEYLAKRDMIEMSEVFNFLGLSVGLVLDETSDELKKEEYSKDIVYSTNTRLGFDYLFDNLEKSKLGKKQGKLNYVILDEIDSILIDDASSPLIISGAGEKPNAELLMFVNNFAAMLEAKTDFIIDEKDRSTILTDSGVAKAEKIFGLENLATSENTDLFHMIRQALQANYIMRKDKDYIVENGEIVLIDQGTGRVSEGRRFSDGLHQAIEAKEYVEIKSENSIVGTITYQNFFKMYKKLSGMSGTVMTEISEFRDVYGLDIVEIPTNKPIKRVDKDDRLFSTNKAKFEAIVSEIKKVHEMGRPILIGTPDIKKSEHMSEILGEEEIMHNLLNAKNHMQEAEMISRAGEYGMITIATNVAGRGTDIKISDEVNKLGGLCVIGTARAKSKRIDNQLIGRSGRQGNNGSSQFFLSYEDDLYHEYYGKDYDKKVKDIICEDIEIKSRKNIKQIDRVQTVVESLAYSSRKETIKYQDIINIHRENIFKDRDSILEEDFDVIEKLKLTLYDVVENDINAILGNVDIEDLRSDQIENLYKNLIIDMKAIYCLEGYSNPNIEEIIEIDNINTLTKYFTRLAKRRVNILVETYGDEFISMAKLIMLNVIDTNWVYHLTRMDALRKEVSYSNVNQVDPFLNYKLKTKKVIEDLVMEMKEEVVKETMMYKFRIGGNI